MRRRLRDRLRGCADAGHGFSFPYCVDASNEPNEYCDSIDITLMKTAKQEHDANISGLRRLCYGWILSPVLMVAHVFNMRAMHVTLLRFTLRICAFPGVAEVWFPCLWLWRKLSVLCKNGDLKLSILCILCLECYIFQYICRR